MTLHIASPIAHPSRIRETLTSLRGAFPLVTPYLASIPLYGGMWMMACCSGTLDPRKLTAHDVDRRIAQRGIGDLQYYNGDVHRACARASQLRPRADRDPLTRRLRRLRQGRGVSLTQFAAARRQTRRAGTAIVEASRRRSSERCQRYAGRPAAGTSA